MHGKMCEMAIYQLIYRVLVPISTPIKTLDAVAVNNLFQNLFFELNSTSLNICNTIIEVQYIIHQLNKSKQIFSTSKVS